MLDLWPNNYTLSISLGRCGMIQMLEQILGVPLSDEQPILTSWVHCSHPCLLQCYLPPYFGHEVVSQCLTTAAGSIA
jgi:hypothetical protein